MSQKKQRTREEILEELQKRREHPLCRGEINEWGFLDFVLDGKSQEGEQAKEETRD
jgi:hypothetical protein